MKRRARLIAAIVAAAVLPATQVGYPAAASAGAKQISASSSAKPAPPAGPNQLADPGSKLPKGWQKSTDEAVTMVGDASGLHVLAASEASGYAWKTVATLGDPSVETNLWIGQDCLTASGTSAVVVYAPEQVTNMAGAQGALGRAAVVDLQTGTVKDLGGGYSVAYFDPGCGAGDSAVLTEGGWANDSSSKAMSTTLALVDTARGSISSKVSVPGQITSAVPYRGQIAAAGGKGVEEISRSGATHLLTSTSVDPFRLTPDAGGGLGFQTVAGDQVRLWRLDGDRAHQVGSATKGSVELSQVGGRVSLVGPGASKVKGLPAQWHAVDVPSNSQLSTTGTLAVTHAASVTAAQGAGAEPTRALPVGINVQLLSGSKASAAFEVSTSPAPTARSAKAPARPGSVKGTGFAATAATTTGSPSTPVSADRTCAVPIDDPKIQAYQPTFQQVEWAADQAVQGKLTDYIPAGYLGSSLPGYVPQEMFPLGLSDGLDNGPTALPAQVLLGVLTQESNLQQASQHVVQGQTSNPLTSFNWYGNWIDGDSQDTGLVNWSNSDCGYGIGQITTGMCLAQGQNNNAQCSDPMPADEQLAVAIDYQANIAASAKMLVDQYRELQTAGINLSIDWDPTKPEAGVDQSGLILGWYEAVWAYNTGLEPNTPARGNTTGCEPNPDCTDSAGNWGLGYADNPANNAYPPDRPTFATSSPSHYPTPLPGEAYGLSWDLQHPQYWPYQDKVMAWAFDSVRLYDYSQGKDVQAFAFAKGTYTQPPFDLWCTAANHCDASGINQTVASGPDPCQLTGEYADHCWWNSVNEPWVTLAIPSDSCTSCGLAVLTYTNYPDDDSEPETEPIAGKFAQTCASTLASDAVIVGDGGQSALGCSGQNWTSQGSFTWNFAPDANGNYSSKIAFDQIGAGFGGHFWFGYAQAGDQPSSTVITGTWSAPSSVTGWTDIQVAIPSYGANADGAVYQVGTGDGGGPGRDVQIDQGATTHTNAWVDLGVFDVGVDGGARVSLSNVTPYVSDVGGDLAWSAVAFIPDPAGGVHYPYTYTAMGDSYASGEGNGPYDPGTAGGCDRSQAAYGRQFAANSNYSSIGDADIQHIACSGATIANLTTTGQNGEEPQDSQISEYSKLITVSMGGNDLGFSSVLSYCLLNPTTCESNYNSDNSSNLYTIMDDILEPKLVSAYEDIKSHAVGLGGSSQGSQVVAVTYPEIFQPGTTCGGILNLPVPDVQFLNSVGLYLDNTIIAAAQQAKINVLDERYAFFGHQLCSSAPWVYSLPTGFTPGTSVLDTSAWFHPTAAGQNQMAQDLGKYWQALQQSSPPAVWPVPLATPSNGWLPPTLPNGIPTDAQASAMLGALTVVASQPGPNAPAYNGSAYNWPSTRDKWDTRNRILVAQVQNPSQLYMWTGNQVAGGTWYWDYDVSPSSMFTPVTYTISNAKPTAVTLDHVVAQANSWISGAYLWPTTYGTTIYMAKADGTTTTTTQGGQMLTDFANDMGDPLLLTASGPSNSSSNNNPPQTWLPGNWGNAGMNCAYAKIWTEVKWNWNLTITQPELTALQNAIAAC